MSNAGDRILAELRRDGRATVSELASRLGLSRATVRAHMDRMQMDGTILGFTVLLGNDQEKRAIQGVVTVALVGGAIDRVVGILRDSPAVVELHSTHGTWDLVLKFAVEDPRELDDLLAVIRGIEGVERTDTSVYLRQRVG